MLIDISYASKERACY